MKCEKCGYEGAAYWGCFGCESKKTTKLLGNPCFTTTEWLDAVESGEVFDVADTEVDQ